MFFHKNPLDSLRIHLRHAEMIEPEEIFSDSSFSLENDPVYEQEKKLEIPLSQRILTVMQALMASAFLFLLGYIAYLGAYRGGEYDSLARKNAERIFYAHAPRGEIFDREGRILATNMSGFDLEIRLNEFSSGSKSINDLMKALSEKINEEYLDGVRARIQGAIEKKLNRLILVRNLTTQEATGLQGALKEFSGVLLRERPMRVYPYGAYTANVVGYTGNITQEEVLQFPEYRMDDDIGKVGVERFYDSSLRGSPGMFLSYVNSVGSTLGEKTVRSSQQGADMYLTIDIDLQRIAFDILSAELKGMNLQKGAVVVLDPTDGSIRALVSLPSYDSNVFVQGLRTKNLEEIIRGKANPLFNRAIAGMYPSGSLVKPFIASAALQERVISPDKWIHTTGSLSVPSIYDPNTVYTFLDWKDNGDVDMRRALAVSSNVYFYIIGGGYGAQEGLGIWRIEKYLRMFGFGKKTGVDLPGEQTGFIPSPQWKQQTKGEEWFIGDTYNMSIGQGDFLVTPLQVGVGISEIANGGNPITPHLAERIGGARYNEPNKSGTSSLLPFSPGIFKVVREGMRKAVLEGSSRMLASLPFSIAGKTGTAEVGKGSNHAWFAGFFPYESPKLTIVVMLENGGESLAAVRVAKEILDKYSDIGKE